ncbi:MAG: exo-alpha-sialidase [Spirosomataceae bacterium]
MIFLFNLLLLILPQNPQESTVFENGEGNYKCFRIPAIIKAKNGDLLAFAEARRENCGDYGDVEIVLKRSSDNGKTWSNMTVVADFGDKQAGNPAPVLDLTDKRFSNGRIFLFYNTGITTENNVRKGQAVREIWYKTSTDGGKTWSDATNITQFVSKPKHPAVNPNYNFTEDWRSYANTPGHALQIQKGKYRGRIFVAANHSVGELKNDSKDYVAHGFYTDDHGKTWQLSPDVPYAGSNESIAIETADGGILMNSRNESRDAKFRIMSYSKDAGKTWSKTWVEQQLPDPICQASMIVYQPKKGQQIILFSNPNSQSKREKLTIKISFDGAKTWSSGKEIYTNSSAYSDLVIQQNNEIGVLFEKDNYSKIVYTNFSYNWLIE